MNCKKIKSIKREYVEKKITNTSSLTYTANNNSLPSHQINMPESKTSLKHRELDICPVHHGSDIEHEPSEPKLYFLRKRGSSKISFRVKQKQKTDEEKKSPTSQNMVGSDISNVQKSGTPSKDESPLQDYKRGSAANSTQIENTDTVSVKSTNTLNDFKSKSFRHLFKSLRKNKPERDCNSKDENEENNNTVFGMFFKEKDHVHKTSLPIHLIDNHENDSPLKTMDSNVVSTQSTPDTVIKLDHIEDSHSQENSFNIQQLNPYDSVYNTQTRSLMEDSLNFDSQTNKNMIKIHNILAKETLNPSRDLFNGYNLNDLSEVILTMVKENNRSHFAQIKIYTDKITKQDDEIFHLKMKLAKVENQSGNLTSIHESSTETITPNNNAMLKSDEALHKNISPTDIRNYLEIANESTKIKQLHNSLRKLEETHSKLVYSQDAMKKYKTQLEKQKEFLTCYKDNSIKFMSFLDSRFKGVVDDDSLSEYTEYLKRFKTNDSLTNSMIFQTSHLAESKAQIDKFFNVISTGLIEDSLSNISKSIQTRDKLEKKLGKAKKIISKQEKKLQQGDKSYQVALYPTISQSSIFVNEKYSGEDGHIPADPLLGP